MMDSQIAILI